jgi:hypothetical protein
MIKKLTLTGCFKKRGCAYWIKNESVPSTPYSKENAQKLIKVNEWFGHNEANFSNLITTGMFYKLITEIETLKRSK